MDAIKQFLTITNEDGSIKTFFGGRITATQLIVICVCILIGLILISKVKKTVKLIILVAMIASTYFNVQLFSPTKLLGTVSTLAESPLVKKQVVELADKSENIRIGDEDALEICVNGTWVNVDKITSFVKLEDGNVSINVGGQDILISDTAIIKLLTLFSR